MVLFECVTVVIGESLHGIHAQVILKFVFCGMNGLEGMMFAVDIC